MTKHRKIKKPKKSRNKPVHNTEPVTAAAPADIARIIEDSEAMIKRFYGRILSLHENEKRRISRDLHDETGQIVIALGAKLNLIEKAIRDGNIDDARALIAENRDMISEIAVRMRAMALNMRPPAMDILGLSATLREYLSEITKSSNIKVEFNENLSGIKMDDDVEITLYRIVQEAMNNVVKHSNAGDVNVDLYHGDRNIKLIVKDNGSGFKITEVINDADPRKIGLKGIRERAHILGGVFDLKSEPGAGTRVEINIPVR
ncbi:MAG: sensor histidine kinase [Candidatus Omnitrophota bacterium]